MKVGNVHAYITGVARNVLLEARRHNARVTFESTSDHIPWDLSSDEEEETEYQLELRMDCLKKCLESLTPVERRLILDYGPPQKGVEKRKELAESLGITLENLRVQVFRARRKLRLLVTECLQRHKES